MQAALKTKTSIVVFNKEVSSMFIGGMYLVTTFLFGLLGAFMLTILCMALYYFGDGRTIKTEVPVEGSRVPGAAEDEENLLNRDNANMD